MSNQQPKETQMAAHGDQRSVTTDALETLGKIHERQEHRDAIHLAVEPVEAGEDLYPGEHILVKDGVAKGCELGVGQGIVDPFLRAGIEKGQRFWFVMYPRQVRSLRHVWTHPDFPDAGAPKADPEPETDEVQQAKAWLAAHAEAMGFTYLRLMDYAYSWLGNGEWIYDNTESYKGVFNAEGFWSRYALVTGETVPEDKRECFFTCSC